MKHDIENLLSSKMLRRHLREDFRPTEQNIAELERFLAHYSWDWNYSKRIACFLNNDLNDFVGRFRALRRIGSSAITLERLVLLYGDTEGQLRWDQYCEKQALSNSFKYKNAKHGWTDQQFIDFNKSRAVTVENLIKKHGENLGLEMWEVYCDRQRYTNTLDYFVETYGHELGREKWSEYNYSKGGSMRAPDISTKLGITLQEAEAILATRFAQNRKCVSIQEQNFVETFEKFLGEPVQYSFKSKQFAMWSDELGSILFYDLVDSTRKKIIEFHGDYWHANPEKYDAEHMIPHLGKTASAIWKRDSIKENTARARGFDYRVVWASAIPDYERLANWWRDDRD